MVARAAYPMELKKSSMFFLAFLMVTTGLADDCCIPIMDASHDARDQPSVLFLVPAKLTGKDPIDSCPDTAWTQLVNRLRVADGEKLKQLVTLLINRSLVSFKTGLRFNYTMKARLSSDHFWEMIKEMKNVGARAFVLSRVLYQMDHRIPVANCVGFHYFNDMVCKRAANKLIKRTSQLLQIQKTEVAYKISANYYEPFPDGEELNNDITSLNSIKTIMGNSQDEASGATSNPRNIVAMVVTVVLVFLGLVVLYYVVKFPWWLVKLLFGVKKFAWLGPLATVSLSTSMSTVAWVLTGLWLLALAALGFYALTRFGVLPKS